jgi:hypothetical protein
MWYLARRLRLAVEVDCDRRVMRTGDLDVRSYAELLLTVGVRRSMPAHAVGFSVGRPFLEQRIDRMTRPAVKGHRVAPVLAALGVAFALGAAWDLPQPVRATEVSDQFGVCPLDTHAVNKELLGSLDWST